MFRPLASILMWCCLLGAVVPAAEKAAKTAAPRPPVRAADLVRDRGDGVDRIPLLPPGPGNPRNSEGAMIALADGRLMLVYTHFTGGGGDHSAAHLAARFSSDQGKTWTPDDVVVVPNEGQWNVMSVSLLRMADGRIALFYLRKESANDCRPVLRFSSDEGKTWSEPRMCIEDEVGYYVMNNDRAVQLNGGQLVLPVCLHCTPAYEKPDWAGICMCYLSDDCGQTWRRSKSQLQGKTPDGKRVTTQEPGVVELKDGRLMLFARTTAGSQFVSYSTDGGDTWSPFQPSSLQSPCSPASIKRVPKTGDLLVVWNNHAGIDPALKNKRTPLHAAISRDEGRTWQQPKVLEDNPDGWYCYIAIAFAGDHVVLAHCSGDTKLVGHLSFTQITRFPIDSLYR
ncbi:MAG: exo-alpha-sialidase [Planctomycetaceae bacterium]|nr:exo-alpha-sialidase [Planctomycetaceae bacterium]